MFQSDALDILKLGHNVFLTGAAGAGKTYLIHQYIRHLRRHQVGVAVTASTGIAATHIGGRTIHSWSGMGVRTELSAKDLAKIKDNKRLKKSVGQAKVLVIDEISMLHPAQLDMVDEIARALLDASRPFGGLQVILCGDFFQLPPVTAGPVSSKNRFAFAARAWCEGDFKVCYLHEQHRQGDDPLLTILNDIRAGGAGEHTKIPLRTRYRREPAGATNATILYSRNINVDALNLRELQRLPGRERRFEMEARGLKALTEGLRKNCLAPEVLHLKKGAEVMFIKNAADGGYANGTRATVIGFDRDEGWPQVRTFDGQMFVVEPAEWTLEEEGVIRASVTQIPLRLAWAITIHKSQGMTLDAVEIDLSDAFEPGMGYVGLSRARRLDGLKLMGLNDMALRVNQEVLARDNVFKQQSDEARRYLKAIDDTEKHHLQKQTLYQRFEGKDVDGYSDNKRHKFRDGTGLAVDENGNRVSGKNSSDIQKPREGTLSDTLHETLALVQQKISLPEIAATRGLKEDTIVSHLEKLKGLNKLPDITYLQNAWASKDREQLIQIFRESENGQLKPVFEKFEGRFSFLELKLARLLSW